MLVIFHQKNLVIKKYLGMYFAKESNHYYKKKIDNKILGKLVVLN